MRKILLSLLVISPLLCTAQMEAYHWYFGDNAGLDFSSGSPVADVNGAMSTDEGCASISDSSGQLLFYTDGMTVYNSNHLPMPNGSGLNGSSTSSQSALIAKTPGTFNQYHIFTTDGYGGPNGLCYSTVDMTLQGGLGDVVLKNQLLTTPVTERMTATHHANGTDIWIMVHDDNDNYYAFLLTVAGVSAPVITTIGSLPSILQGSMKFSPAGDRLASPFQGQFFFEVMDFDNSTGVLSNLIQLYNSNWYDPFSVEFSPSGNYLYGAYDPSGTGYLLQFDLSLGSAAAIVAGAVQIGFYNGGYFGSLQLGPDLKLYAGEQNNDYVGVVNFPDSPGVACDFVINGVYLGGMTSNYGLPNFITSYFNQQLPPVAFFNAPNHLCPGTCTSFLNNSTYASSYLWSFPGAVPNTSVDVNPTNICYNTPGNYSVTLIATGANGSDTLTLNNYITVYPHPAPQGISQSGDTLFAIAGATSYQWYFNGSLLAGATDYFYVADSSGDYNVVATDNNGCEVEAVIFNVIAGLTPAHSIDEGVQVFPNPAGRKLEIRIPMHTWGKSGVAHISVYNMLGERIAVQSAIKNQNSTLSMDVGGLSAGMYHIEITGIEKIIRTKFVKD